MSYVLYDRSPAPSRWGCSPRCPLRRRGRSHRPPRGGEREELSPCSSIPCITSSCRWARARSSIRPTARARHAGGASPTGREHHRSGAGAEQGVVDRRRRTSCHGEEGVHREALLFCEDGGPQPGGPAGAWPPPSSSCSHARRALKVLRGRGGPPGRSCALLLRRRPRPRIHQPPLESSRTTRAGSWSTIGRCC
jgi:hypothetical protein